MSTKMQEKSNYSVYAQISYEISSLKEYVVPDGKKIVDEIKGSVHTTNTLLRPYGTEEFKCKGCNKEQSYTKPKIGKIQEIACSHECAKKIGFAGNFDPHKYLEKTQDTTGTTDKTSTTGTTEKATSEKNATCPKCGGVKRGRGYTHREDCSENSVKKPDSDKPAVCSECGGKKRGRGYAHAKECKLSCQVQLAAKKKTK